MNIVTFYLPQFHSFPENDEWWGKGFTEWTNTKKTKPLFKGHQQPNTPLGDNYYDLSNVDSMRKQIKIANQYGIYGFCFYHYWFNGKKLMEKPVENFLADKTLNTHFCISWANESWTRAWDGRSKQVLIEQTYGTEKDWIQHFEYLLPYFQDDRYIKIDGKPLLIIYRPELMDCFDEMMMLWGKKAKENGLSGLYVMAQGARYCFSEHQKKSKNKNIDGYIMFEPGYSMASLSVRELKDMKSIISAIKEFRKLYINYMPRKIIADLSKVFVKNPKTLLDRCDFSVLWETILDHKIPNDYYPGGFANWDNTPRRGPRGRVITNSTPELFQKYLKKQIFKARNEYQKDFLFFTAWNEWAEGSYLEPDERYQYSYLEAVKNALIETNEWPQNL